MKPVSKGHWNLIKRASEENDKVILYVSTSDRGDDDVMIRGSDMLEIWERYLKPHLPANVLLEFCVNPIRKIYQVLGEANEIKSIDEYAVYSDPSDIRQRFPEEKQRKYFGDLYKYNQVSFVEVDRVGELDVSGTQMRSLLKHGMKDAFMTLLPEGVDKTGIWETLVLRSFIRNV